MVKKLPRWQKEQKQRRVSQTRLMIGRLLAAVVVIFTAGLLVGFGGILKRSLWNGQTRLTLAVASRPVRVISFSPQEQSLGFLTFADNTYLEAIHGYGNYLLESIYPLGELEGKGGGGALLAKSLQENLGLVIDGYISIPNSEFRIQNSESEAKGGFIGIVVSLLKNQGETNLNRWDLIRLWWEAGKVRKDKINLVNLDKPLDPERLEGIIGPYFLDEKIREEALTIAVLNTTNQPGLAAQQARIIKNLGGRIVSLGDAADEKCQIRSARKNKESQTVKRLAQIFGCPWAGEDLLGQRADLVLVLGEMI